MSELTDKLRATYVEDYAGQKIVGAAADEIERLQGLVDCLGVAMNALQEIGAYSDRAAHDRLKKTGSYGSFDEPGSVQISREAMERILSMEYFASKALT